MTAQPPVSQAHTRCMAVHAAARAACECYHTPGEKQHESATYRFALDHVMVDRNLVLHCGQDALLRHTAEAWRRAGLHRMSGRPREAGAAGSGLAASAICNRVPENRVPLVPAHLYCRRALGRVDHRPVLLHDLNLVGVELPDVPVAARSSRRVRRANATRSMAGPANKILHLARQPSNTAGGAGASRDRPEGVVSVDERLHQCVRVPVQEGAICECLQELGTKQDREIMHQVYTEGARCSPEVTNGTPDGACVTAHFCNMACFESRASARAQYIRKAGVQRGMASTMCAPAARPPGAGPGGLRSQTHASALQGRQTRAAPACPAAGAARWVSTCPAKPETARRHQGRASVS